ncbi:MAG: deiodinase-like protein [Oligoflexales bacterium]
MHTMDDTIADSFPASDPPSWTGVTGVTSAHDTGRHGKKDSYNYEHFSANAINLESFSSPKVGEKMPNLTFMTLENKPVNLYDLLKTRTVLITASLTCPMFNSNVEGLAQLADTFHGVRFMLLYVREAHPGENIPPPKNMMEKITRAIKLKSSLPEPMDVYVDYIDGSGHKILGGFPNCVFVLNTDATVYYRSNWFNPDELSKALTNFRNIPMYESDDGISLPQIPPIGQAFKVLKNSGLHAVWDFTKSVPQLMVKRLQLKHRIEHKTPTPDDVDDAV